MGKPNVYPTSTTIYKPEKCYSGYTLFSVMGHGAILVDMNGRVVRHWKDFMGFPPKMIPGGYLFGSRGLRDRTRAYQDQSDVTMVDMDGNVIWSFNRNQEIDDGDGPKWYARQHHDYQIEGNPVGYFVPGMESSPDFQKMLILTHNDVRKPKISPQLLLEDRLIEIDREGNIVWEWRMLDHFNEFGMTETQKNVMFRNPNRQEAGDEGEGDIFHVNCASYLGPNKWHDAGDERFAPDNIIMDSREANIMWIVDHGTGEVVWKVGPDFTQTRELRMLGTVVGPHHTHMIPKGLPGEGNVMVYDNGGWAGYGDPCQHSRMGLKVTRRDGSRVVEFDPTTLEIKWELKDTSGVEGFAFNAHYFYSPLTSDAQRLPNGNTFICEGTSGHLMEFTADKELVWEFHYPYMDNNVMYRAYRIPYEWIPQLEKPEEVAIEPIDIAKFQMPGAHFVDPEENVVRVEGAVAPASDMAECVEGLD